MKILQICTCDYGGAGKAALRTHLGLKSLGASSKMLVLYKRSFDPDVIKLIENDTPLRKLLIKVRRRLFPWKYNNYIKTNAKAIDIFTNPNSPYDITNHPLVKEADIINLRWIAELVDYQKFFSSVQKPLIWRLSDMNSFTGGCHYSNGCTKYKTGCGSCPQLSSNNSDDISRKTFKIKEATYKKHNIHIVSPSKWLADLVTESLLFKNYPISVIPSGISTDIFIKQDKKLSRDKLNLPQGKTIILFGAAYKTKRKGLKYLVEALKLLKKKPSSSNIALAIFGPPHSQKIISKETNFDVYSLGYINDETLLSHAYSAADIFVIPSLEEAFGQVCLEAMACGTPVIGFNTGGILDMITPHKTGLLAEVKNTQDLASKIEYMMTHPQERETMGKNARKRIEQEYTLQTQAKRYLKLYEMMLSKNTL